MRNKLVRIYYKLTDKKKSYKFTSIKKFCETIGYKYDMLSETVECEELRPRIWNIRKNSLIISRELPETYIAEIRNGIVFGENEIIVSNGIVLSDIFANFYAKKMVLKKGVVKKIDLESQEVQLYYHNYRNMPIDKAINLVGIFPYSYYHFLVNILPKLYYFSKREEYKDYPLLIDTRAYDNFKEIIDLFNVDKRKIICVKPHTACMVKNLIVSSNCAWYDRYVREEFLSETGFVYDKEAMQFIRKHAISMCKKREENRRVFISRKKMPEERRRIVEEDRLEKMFEKYGFISVCPEELTFLEQVQLFSETKILAGATGAAFTNVIFLPSDATIIYFTPTSDNKTENLFSTLWNSVGEGRTIVVEGKVTEETKGMKDNLRKFEIDFEETEKMLNSL